MMWLICVLTAFGTAVITCVVMEAYYQRRAADRIYDYDLPGDHRAGS